jgi:hypothetical protein
MSPSHPTNCVPTDDAKAGLRGHPTSIETRIAFYLLLSSTLHFCQLNSGSAPLSGAKLLRAGFGENEHVFVIWISLAPWSRHSTQDLLGPSV